MSAVEEVKVADGAVEEAVVKLLRSKMADEKEVQMVLAALEREGFLRLDDLMETSRSILRLLGLPLGTYARLLIALDKADSVDVIAMIRQTDVDGEITYEKQKVVIPNVEIERDPDGNIDITCVAPHLRLDPNQTLIMATEA